MNHRASLLPAAVVAALLTGCPGRSVKVDNPVMGPPPPRVSLDEHAHLGDAYVNDTLDPAVDGYEPGAVVPVSLDEVNDRVENLDAARVVARVNGEPIFQGDVLEPYRSHLERARGKISEREMADLQEQIVERDLPVHIERKLLVQGLRSQLKQEQLDQLDEQLDTLFEEHVVANMMEQVGVGSRLELERELRKQGQSLDSMQIGFANQEMAKEYLRSEATEKPEIGRPEIHRYYRDHIEDYAHPARARWQRLRIRFREHGGKDEALKVLDEAIDDLRSGADFGEVVKRYSDGPKAKRGGHWDWTEKGSLADKRIDKALFQLPVGKISQVFLDENSIEIVKVVERKRATYTPFVEVQEEIRATLESENRERATREVLEGLKQKAEISTIFDDEEEDASDAVVLPFR